MDIISIIGIVTGLISIIVVIWKMGFQWSALFNEVDNHKKQLTLMQDEIKKISSMANDCHTKIEPFWELIRQQLPNLLIVPRSKNLLEKLSDDSITNEELLYLEDEIENKMLTNHTDKTDILRQILCLWSVKVRKKERELDD